MYIPVVLMQNIYIFSFPTMDAIIMKKDELVSIKKEDGSALSKIRIGASWDPTDEGGNKDLDLFVVHRESGVFAFYNKKDAINGVSLGADNRTGEGDGDDETVKMDATKTSDGTYAICINIYDAISKNQKFSQIKNARVTVYNDEDGSVLATYKVTEDGGDHTALHIGDIKDSGDNYTFTAKGVFIDGSCDVVAQSLKM